jgi:predicted amidohydrolase
LHLFDVEIQNGPVLLESKTTLPGQQIIPPLQTPFGRVGLATCYDLRFPELSTILQKQGMDILTYPSAFTVKTGVAHWDILLRCRAIETQSFVIAAAQVGKHTETRESYGHAMIVDPWGEVLVNCNTEHESIGIADIDLDRLLRIRSEMPVLKHRRNDVYSLQCI